MHKGKPLARERLVVYMLPPKMSPGWHDVYVLIDIPHL